MALALLYVAGSLTLCPGAAGSHSVVSVALWGGQRISGHAYQCLYFALFHILIIQEINYKHLGLGLVCTFKGQLNPFTPLHREAREAGPGTVV